MKAYHNDPQIKADIIKQLEAHRDADKIIKGQYWEKGKGCAVGCTIHSNDHSLYEKLFGIPENLAYLKNIFSENISNRKAKNWPILFMDSFEVGKDYRLVEWKFKHRLLTDKTINPGINHPLVAKPIADVAALIERKINGENISNAEWTAVRSAARTAWSLARSAWSLARTAESTAARAARAAAWAAESAIRVAVWAARSTARSIAWASSRPAESAALAPAWSAELACERMADKLIELIKAE